MGPRKSQQETDPGWSWGGGVGGGGAHTPAKELEPYPLGSGEPWKGFKQRIDRHSQTYILGSSPRGRKWRCEWVSIDNRLGNLA